MALQSVRLMDSIERNKAGPGRADSKGAAHASVTAASARCASQNIEYRHGNP